MKELLSEWLGLIFNGAVINSLDYDNQLHRDVIAVLQNCNIVERVNMTQFILHSRFKAHFDEKSAFISVPKRVAVVYALLEEEIKRAESKFSVVRKEGVGMNISNNETDKTITHTRLILSILKDFLP
jgi:hypothetical protein